MEPHQQRVVDEKSELDEKIEKLEAFFTNPIFHKLSFDERTLLHRQNAIMSLYSMILGERIELFQKGN